MNFLLQNQTPLDDQFFLHHRNDSDFTFGPYRRNGIDRAADGDTVDLDCLVQYRFIDRLYRFRCFYTHADKVVRPLARDRDPPGAKA